MFIFNRKKRVTTRKNNSYTGRARLIQTRLIRNSTLFEVSLECFPIISCLKYMVNSYFHLLRRESLLANDFELTMPDL